MLSTKLFRLRAVTCQPAIQRAMYSTNPSDEVQKLQAQLAQLKLVPSGTEQLNELEKQDLDIRRQRKLSKAAVQMKKLKPITPSLRWYRVPIYPYLHKGRAVKQLTVPLKKNSGRNNTGRITVRHRGGGFKRRLRLVDFFRKTPGVQKVVRIEYDPVRTAHIALVEHSETKALSYILATVGMRSGDSVESFRSGIPKRIIEAMNGQMDPAILASFTAVKGNCLPLSMIPIGSIIHNIALRADGPGQLCRSAGTYARLFEKIPEKGMAVVRLQSGEHRYIPLSASATMGIVSNPDHQHSSLGKAGRKRNMGWRPTVRGVAMNNVDHPHGGGRGKSKGNKLSVSPWGTLAKGGYKTRIGKNVNRMKVKDRREGV